jgi:hypothetical protein
VSNLLYTSISKPTCGHHLESTYHHGSSLGSFNTNYIFRENVRIFKYYLFKEKIKQNCERQLENLAEDEEGNIPFFDMECSKLIN